MNQRQTIAKGFLWAYNGIRESFHTQINFRIHILIASVMLVLGWWLHIEPYEWLALVLTIVMVIAFEQINTAVEYLVDLVSPEYHVMAGKVKDISAGAVLLTAIGAVAVGIIIFLPKLILMFQ